MPSIFDRLNFTDELEIGEIQSADEMTVVPIVGQKLADVASPQALQFEGTQGYGTMVFRNDEDKPVIVPAHLQVRGRGAQDHAMSGAGFIKKQSVKSFSDACCIESSQGGMLNAAGNELDILPAELRKAFLDKTFRFRTEFGKLWDRIKDWLGSIPGISHRGQAHLRYFYDHPQYRQALEDFAAEFEPIPGQIGAIIMFNGVPVGLEIMPTSEHWAHYWKLLIRGCYGAELIRLKKSGNLPASTLVLPSIPDDAEDEEVEKIMTDFVHNLRTSLIPLIEQIKVKSSSELSQEGDMKLKLVRTDSGGGGDLITKDDKPIYLSMVL